MPCAGRKMPEGKVQKREKGMDIGLAKRHEMRYAEKCKGKNGEVWRGRGKDSSIRSFRKSTSGEGGISGNNLNKGLGLLRRDQDLAGHFATASSPSTPALTPHTTVQDLFLNGHTSLQGRTGPLQRPAKPITHTNHRKARQPDLGIFPANLNLCTRKGQICKSSGAKTRGIKQDQEGRTRTHGRRRKQTRACTLKYFRGGQGFRRPQDGTEGAQQIGNTHYTRKAATVSGWAAVSYQPCRGSRLRRPNENTLNWTTSHHITSIPITQGRSHSRPGNSNTEMRMRRCCRVRSAVS